MNGEPMIYMLDPVLDFYQMPRLQRPAVGGNRDEPLQAEATKTIKNYVPPKRRFFYC